MTSNENSSSKSSEKLVTTDKKDKFKNIYWMLTDTKRLLKMSTLLRSVCSVIG